MPKSNPARNRILYPLWQERRTIKEASLLTGIPPSTVGYYFKKYKRYAKEGRPVVIPQATQESPQTQLDSSIFSKTRVAIDAMQMLTSGHPENAYYLLGTFKLLRDLGLQLTREEIEAFPKSLQPSTGAPLAATTRKTTQMPSQSIESARVAKGLPLPMMTMKHPEAGKMDLVEIALREIKKNPQSLREFEEKIRHLYAEREEDAKMTI